MYDTSRVRFARIDGEVRQAQNLRAFDFRIPVRAFDQSDHDVAITDLCQRI